VTLDQLESCQEILSEVVYRRCRHVVTEDDRVLEAAAALEQKRFDELRRVIAESDRSLREDYEVSCRELDLLVDLAGQTEGLYGARMTGAGFGGCTINLVHSDSVDAFRNWIETEYEKCTGLMPDVYVCDAADGVGTAS